MRYHVCTAANTVAIEHPAEHPASVLADLVSGSTTIAGVVFVPLEDAESGNRCLVRLDGIDVIEASP